MTVALLGGTPDRFVPLVNLFRQSARQAGHNVSQLPLAINSHFYIADDSQRAANEFYPFYAAMMNRVGKERGWSPLGRDQFEYLREYGPLLVGSPQQVIDKILYFHELFGNTRYLAQLIGSDTQEHTNAMHAIELFGTKVAPEVRKVLNGAKIEVAE
jgi:alkanesulfonate monooxygenase SsuD/methylene tetrahydromethanopterin reductase-like flavin-dependent oxidoreductase (luciferase family)